jgi:hypothetical protein
MITILMIKIIEFVTRGYHRTLRFIESDSPILPVLNRSFHSAQFVCPHCGPWPQSLLVRQGTNGVKGTMPIQYFMHVVTVGRLLIRMQAVLYS